MRLYLSSENLGRHADRLIRMVGDKRKVAYIPNARDFWEDSSASGEKTEKHRSQFQELGFEFKEFDLKQYFGDKKLSQDIFNDFGLFWLPGGNTFLLRRAMYDSGLDVVIRNMLDNDLIVYGGSSAGSIVATPSLRGTEFGDRPEDVTDIYGKEIIWDGLNLVDIPLSVHVGTEWFKDESEKVNRYFEENRLVYQRLRDGEVLVIDGEREELLR